MRVAMRGGDAGPVDAPTGGCSSRPRGAASARAAAVSSRRRGQAEGRPSGAARDVGDVGDDGGGGGVAAGAGADQRQLAHRVGIDGDGVGHAHHLRDGEDFGTMVGWTRCSMPVARALGDAEQLDAVAEFVGHLQVERRDRRDALDMDRLGVDLGAEGEARQDGELVGGVEAVDVEGRVGLRIAEALRVLQAVVEGQPLQLHAGEDVVAGAVEDAVDARDGIAGERFAQRLDDRDAAGDRGLEGERDAVLFGQRRKRAPCWASSALLAVTTGLPRLQRRLDGRRRPGLAPPISSTKQSMSADLASATGSSNQVIAARDRRRGPGRGRARRPPATRDRRGRTASESRAVRARMRMTEAPTVPRPAMPTRKCTQCRHIEP